MARTITAPEQESAPDGARVGGTESDAWRGRRLWEAGAYYVAAPLAGAIVVAMLASGGTPLSRGAVTMAILACGCVASRYRGDRAALLPLVRHLQPVSGPLIGTAGLVVLQLAAGFPRAGVPVLVGTWAASALVLSPGRRLAADRRIPQGRAALIGSDRCARRLARTLELVGPGQYELVGRIRLPDEDPFNGETAGNGVVGGLDELGDTVDRHGVDLLVLGSDAPRLEAFEAVVATCLGRGVPMVDVSTFHEEAFGHVPVAEINAAWFRCLVSPGYPSRSPISKRILDVVGAAVLAALAAPVIIILALLIRRDGGPSLFRQLRVGEGGRRFWLYKLRTMRPEAGSSAQWASLDDPRITRLGRVLRRTHLDELPQLLNVLRGEMSLVGPRPEQPEFVARLERRFSFYQSRRLIKPGITGWAQIRCGYAGSDIGSAWKLCHDLYYIKNRSMGLDLLILLETLATLFFPREPVVKPESVDFIAREPGRARAPIREPKAA